MRGVLKVVLVLVAALALALVAARVVLELPAVRERLGASLSAALTQGDTRVRIEELAGMLPFSPSAARIEIADRAGVWLTIEGLRAEVAPLPLLRREVHVRSIAAERVTFLRLPLPDEDPFKLHPLRLGVRVDTLDVHEILLGRELLADEQAPEWTGPVTAHASGSVDLRRLTLDAAMTASMPHASQLARGSGIGAGEARVALVARGAIAAPSGEATLQLSDVTLAAAHAARFEIHAEGERLGMGERRYRVTVAADAEALDGAPADVQALLGADPSMNGVVLFGESPRVFDIESLTLAAATFAAELSASGDGGDTIAVSSLTAAWPDLTIVPAVDPYVDSGTLRLHGSGRIVVGDGGGWFRGLTAELAIKAEGLVLSDPRLRALAGVAPSLDLVVAGGRSATWSADAVTLTGAGVRATGKATFESSVERANVDLAFSLPDLAVLGREVADLDLEGGVEGTLALDGSLGAPEVTAKLRAQRVRVGRSGVLGGELTIAVSGDAAAPRARLDAGLTVDGLPLRASGRARYVRDHDVVGLEALSVDAPATTLTAKGEILLGGRLAAGTVRLDSKDLSKLTRLLGVECAGRANGTFDLTHDTRAQTVKFIADANELRLIGLLAESIAAGSASVRGEIRDLWGRFDGRVDASATKLDWGELHLATADLDVERARGSAQFDLETSGRYRGDLTAHVAGRHIGDWSVATLVIDRLEGSVRGHVLRATKPLELATRDGEVTVRQLALAVDAGNVEGSWSAGGVRGVGAMRAVDLPLDLAKLVTENLSLGGHVSGELARSARGEDLVLRASSTDAAVAAGEGTGAAHGFALDVTARVAAWRSHVDAQVVAASDASTISVVAELPFGFVGGKSNGPLGGRMHGTLTADLIDELVLPDNERLLGKLDIDLSLGGTFDAPLLDGRAGGRLRYTSGATGMDLRLDEIEIRADGRRLEVVAFRGTDGARGRLDGRGTIELGRDGAGERYDLGLKFTDTYVAKLDGIALSGDGSFALRGPKNSLVLAGTFSADEATLRIPDRLPPDVETLPVEYVNLAASRNATVVEEPSPVDSPIALDVVIDVPDRLRVEDPNLDSEWRGKLFVEGNTARPDVKGELVAVRGRFDLAGVRFATTEGRLTFEEATNVPSIDVTAVADRNEIEATLRLRGPADRPTIDLTSTPALPQDEILSRLMFGETAGTLTAGQSLQLAQAAARLSGRGSGFGSTWMSRVRRYAGVDRIEIKDSGSSEQASTQVSVGKYVGDRVYVSYDQAVQGVGSKARVEVEMTNHLSAETEVGQDENASVGVRWRWNY